MTVKCTSCGTSEGSLHNRGCSRERCPFCFGQAISCACQYRAAGYKPQAVGSGHPTMGLPKEVFENGLSNEQEQLWDERVNKKGRIPYFNFPWICCRCGSVDPHIFMVPDNEWKRVVPRHKRREILCRECFDYMAKCIDDNS